MLLTEIKIKRISKFDLDKAQQYIDSLEEQITEVKHHLANLIEFSIKHPKSIVQAAGSWSDNKDIVHYAGRIINWWTAKGTFIHDGEKLSDYPSDYKVRSDTLTGRGVLFPIQVFKEVGNYDLRIIHRGDPEFTKRASKAGWSLWVYFGAVVYSYPVEGKGNINERANFKLKDIKEYFFGALSSAHLPTMWRNARTYTNSFFQAVIFFICHFIRMLFHFIVRLKLHGD